MKIYIQYTLIIVSILLITMVLLQNRGSGLGSAFGSSFNFYSAKRGVEKILHFLTIIFSIIFLGLSLSLVLIK